MDKMEREAAGARSTRHLRRRPVMAGLAAGAGPYFVELFLSLSRRRNVMTVSPDDHMLVEKCRARANRGVRRLGPALPGETVPSITTPVRVSGGCQGRFARHVPAPTRSSINFTATARSTHGSIGSASISRFPGTGAGVRGSWSGAMVRTHIAGLKTRLTNRPMRTQPTLWSGPSASRSSKPRSTSLDRSTVQSSSSKTSTAGDTRKSGRF